MKQNIKKLFFALFALLAVVASDAKLKVTEDEFLGGDIVTTGRVRIVDGRWYTLTVELEHKSGRSYLVCNFWANRAFSISEGETVLYLKFDDGTIGKAVCVDDVQGAHSGISLRERHAEFVCMPDSGLVEKMASNAATRFRLTTSLGDIEYDIKGRRSKQLRKQAVEFKEFLDQAGQRK